VKQYFFFILICATLLWGNSSQAVGELGANNGDNSNPHNLSSLSRNSKKADTETQICIFCHTPHGAVANAPLWGRPDPTGSFGIRAGLGISEIVNTTLYSTDADYPNGSSKLCLSCHDGVTAMGILANGEMIDMSGGNALEIDLTISHPISFVYNSDVKNYLGASYTLPTDSSYLDGSLRVQCTSCHQPHQDTRGAGGVYPFWRKGNGDAADYGLVCQECHTSTPTLPGIPGTKEHQYN
jgi:mono/diheme cytochrome c family protein